MTATALVDFLAKEFDLSGAGTRWQSGRCSRTRAGSRDRRARARPRSSAPGRFLRRARVAARRGARARLPAVRRDRRRRRRDAATSSSSSGPSATRTTRPAATYTPGFILNYGLIHRVELVFDAHHALLYGGVDPPARRRALDTAMLAKVVARQGCLQGQPGPERRRRGRRDPADAARRGRRGRGAHDDRLRSAGRPAALHVNVEGDYTREHTFAFIGGAIVEGPDRWAVRPVVEPLRRARRRLRRPSSRGWAARSGARTSTSTSTPPCASLARAAQNIYEVRAGLTWTVASCERG